jgi:hypothetical protein
VAALSPSFKMFHMVKEKFKDVPFGAPQVGHVCPTWIDY